VCGIARVSARAECLPRGQVRRDTGRTVSQENVEVVKRANALLNRGAWDEMALLSDPDIVLRDLRNAADTQQALEGSQSVLALLAHWSEAFDDFGAEVIEYLTPTPTWSATADGMPGASGVRYPLTCTRPTSTSCEMARSSRSRSATPTLPTPSRQWGWGSRARSRKSESAGVLRCWAMPVRSYEIWNGSATPWQERSARPEA
jgi:hypothetical protein